MKELLSNALLRALKNTSKQFKKMVTNLNEIILEISSASEQ